MGIKTRDFPRTRTHTQTGRHMEAQGGTCTARQRDRQTERYTRAQREKCCSHEPSAQLSSDQTQPKPNPTKAKATAHRICNANKKLIQRLRLPLGMGYSSCCICSSPASCLAACPYPRSQRMLLATVTQLRRIIAPPNSSFAVVCSPQPCPPAAPRPLSVCPVCLPACLPASSGQVQQEVPIHSPLQRWPPFCRLLKRSLSLCLCSACILLSSVSTVSFVLFVLHAREISEASVQLYTVSPLIACYTSRRLCLLHAVPAVRKQSKCIYYGIKASLFLSLSATSSVSL